MWRLLAWILCGAVAADGAPATPVFFVANRGQAPDRVQFLGAGSGLTASFLRREIRLRTPVGAVKIQFDGANSSPRLEGSGALAGRAHFLIGPANRWHRGEPIFAAVRYRGLYPHIDMLYSGTGRQWKSEFVVAPAGDPARIRIRYGGVGAPRIEADGSLAMHAGQGEMREGAPYVYQQQPDGSAAVAARFVLADDGSLGFKLGPYDRSLPLIIDPVLSFSTVFGGTGFNAATAIAVDAGGATYLSGYTDALNLPTVDAEQTGNAGGNEAFVAKVSPSGSIVYCTYIGGSGDDRAYGIAVDASGAAYVAGFTTSTDFPTKNGVQKALNGGRSAFVLKLSADGSGLVFSTYLGGSGSDTAYAIAVDGSGNSYIVGDTTSMDFPAGGFQTSYHGSQDVFVSKISADGSHLAYSTYLGGSATDHGAAIAVDAAGLAYVTGYTWSPDFPAVNAYQRTIGGGCDAFVAHFSSDGNTLQYSTYLGGSGGTVAYPEAGTGIAVDAQDDAYITGVTSSDDFPLSKAVQPELLGSTDAFIAKFNASGSMLFSTYMGGSSIEIANAIAVDPSGAVFIAGYTYSDDFPVTVNAVQTSLGGGCDAFVVKLSPTGDLLLYATYLGGGGSDAASGLAISPAGDVYVSGWTFSADFPVPASGS